MLRSVFRPLASTSAVRSPFSAASLLSGSRRFNEQCAWMHSESSAEEVSSEELSELGIEDVTDLFADTTTASAFDKMTADAFGPWDPSSPTYSVQAFQYDFSSTAPTGIISLHREIFGIVPRIDIMHDVVKWQLAKRRQGTQHVKRRHEVSYSTRKIYAQKGGGRARHGDRGAAGFVKGGRAHAPHPRSYEYNLNRKVRHLGMRSALAAKFHAGKLIIFDDESSDAAFHQPETPKTKAMQQYLAGLNGSVSNVAKPSFLWIQPEVGENMKLATSNLSNIRILKPEGLNVYDVLGREYLVLSRKSLPAVEERLL